MYRTVNIKKLGHCACWMARFIKEATFGKTLHYRKFTLLALSASTESPLEIHFVYFSGFPNDVIKANTSTRISSVSLWRHDMETFSALLTLYERNPPVIDGFPSQRASNASFEVFFSVILNKSLDTQSSYRWFGMPWHNVMSLWCIELISFEEKIIAFWLKSHWSCSYLLKWHGVRFVHVMAWHRTDNKPLRESTWFMTYMHQPTSIC